MVVAEQREEGERSYCFVGSRSQICKMKNFWRRTAQRRGLWTASTRLYRHFEMLEKPHDASLYVMSTLPQLKKEK